MVNEKPSSKEEEVKIFIETEGVRLSRHITGGNTKACSSGRSRVIPSIKLELQEKIISRESGKV